MTDDAEDTELLVSVRQQQHQSEFDRARAELSDALAAVNQPKAAQVPSRSAIQAVISAADRLCVVAEGMPAAMDEDAQERSSLIVRLSGAGQLATTLLTVALVLFGMLGRGWWFAVPFIAASAGILLLCPVGPPGSPWHARQRRPAILAPIFSLAAVLVSAVTSWSAAIAVVLLIVGLWSALVAGLEGSPSPAVAAESTDGGGSR